MGMRIDLLAVLREAGARWRADRALLLPLAALFLFVPQWGVLLLLPEPPRPVGAADQATVQAWVEAMSGWTQRYGLWQLGAYLLVQFGQLAIVALYVAEGPRPTVGGALVQGLRRLARFVLAGVLVSFPLGAAGLLLMGVPGALFLLVPATFYLLGRTVLAGPAMLASGRVGAARSLAASWRWTAGNGAALALLVGGLVLGAPVVAQAARTSGDLMRQGGIANPVVVAAVDAMAAALAAAAMLLLAMVAGVLYRRLAR